MWIKVKKKLPEISENKLLFLKNHKRQQIGFLVKRKKYYWKVLKERDLYPFDSVSHWQDLPENPEINWWDDLEELPKKVIFKLTSEIYDVNESDFELGYVIHKDHHKQYLVWASAYQE